MEDLLLPDKHKQNDFFICDVFDSFRMVWILWNTLFLAYQKNPATGRHPNAGLIFCVALCAAFCALKATQKISRPCGKHPAEHSNN
jgi:hypothetical protein